MATPTQLQAFEGILTTIAAEAEQLPDQELTGFLPVVGKAYAGELMIVGRAVNGWADGVTPRGLAPEGAASRFARHVQERSLDDGACPMAWVERRWGVNDGGYNSARSAFWRGVNGVSSDLVGKPSGPGWSSRLVWSNLYEIAAAGGGNPSTTLQDLKRDTCVGLLASEIETYEPERILFLTGLDWAAPFLKHMHASDPRVGSGRFAEWVGPVRVDSGHTARGVVAPHPQGKPGAQWTDEVVTAFRASR